MKKIIFVFSDENMNNYSFLSIRTVYFAIIYG